MFIPEGSPLNDFVKILATDLAKMKHSLPGETVKTEILGDDFVFHTPENDARIQKHLYTYFKRPEMIRNYVKHIIIVMMFSIATSSLTYWLIDNTLGFDQHKLLSLVIYAIACFSVFQVYDSVFRGFRAKKLVQHFVSGQFGWADSRFPADVLTFGVAASVLYSDRFQTKNTRYEYFLGNLLNFSLANKDKNYQKDEQLKMTLTGMSIINSDQAIGALWEYHKQVNEIVSD